MRVREIEGSLEQWGLGAKDVQRRMLLRVLYLDQRVENCGEE